MAACGGGGGNGGGDNTAPPSTVPQFSVAPTSLSFSAADPSAATPLPLAVTATINGVDFITDRVFIRVVITGTAAVAVENLGAIRDNRGRGFVSPANPGILGPGTHTGVITVSACTTDSNCSGPQLSGSPATINVTYQVGPLPPPPDAVAPAVGTAALEGDVTLRGSGFSQVSSVRFGATPAVTFSVVSDVEILARHPALAAGAHPIALNNGSIPFTASLHVVDPAPLAAATLAYPSAPQNMRGFAYDARRQALVVGAGFSAPSGNQMLRYAFSDGAWQAPQALPLPNLRDLILSLDGERLLAITDTTLAEINPTTLGLVATSVRPTNIATDATDHLKVIVAANDGKAVVLSRSSNFGQLWLYDIARRTFTAPRDVYFNPAAGGPVNGARVVWFDSGLSPLSPARLYNASSGTVTSTQANVLDHFHPVTAQAENINPPVFNRSGSRMLVVGSGQQGAFHAVFDANFAELGRVPSFSTSSTTAAYALAPDEARAYILEVGPGLCRVRAFDVSAPPGAGLPFPETLIGFPINLIPNCPASTDATPIRMLLDPAGNTLFIAGNLTISVVPLP